MARNAPFDPLWLLEDDRDGRNPRAVAWWFDETEDHEGGQVVAYSFGLTNRGVIDLVGFMISGVDDSRAAMQVVQQWSREAARCARPSSLTSRQLRTAASQQGLLQRARATLTTRRIVLDRPGGLTQDDLAANWLKTAHPGVEVRTGGRQRTLTDEFLAGVVVEYAALFADERGRTRERLAERRHATDAAVKRWLHEARKRGLWRTSGPGKPGQPTNAAFDLVKNGDTT